MVSYTSNKCKIVLKKMVAFTICSYNRKYLGMKITKVCKISKKKHYKAMVEVVKEDLNSYGLEGCIVKIIIQPKLIYRFYAIPIKMCVCVSELKS